MIANGEVPPEILERSFQVYSDLLESVNLEHPQRQGLTAEELGRAILSPSILKTPVSPEVSLPQLAPVTAFDWLNEDYYKKRFPQDFESNLMHFSNIPGIEPGEEVRQGLFRLAESRGILAFDAPSSDKNYVERTLNMLEGLEIEYNDLELIGTQTYFAGQVILRKDRERREIATDMLETFEQKVASGVYARPEDITDGASLVRTIDPDQAEILRQLYDDAYVVLNDHPCKQGLSPDEFKEMLTSDHEVGKLIYVRNGEIETLCLLTNDLTKLSWVNADYYARQYPQRYAHKQMVWFPGIATDPVKQGERNTGHLINLMAELAEYGDNEFVGLFDFCDMNTGWLDRVFEDMINSAPQTEIELKPIAEQGYWVARLSSKD